MNELKRGYEQYQKEYDNKIAQILKKGWYVLGDEVVAFEKEFALWCGRKECIGVASGLDALKLAFRVLNIHSGDEVIVAGNAYIACVMGISENGATPVFVEPDSKYNIDVNKIEEKISDKTKAILAVHLYGQMCKMDKVMELARKYNLYVVEDCAQAHGAYYKGKIAGSYGDMACFSFYPSKNMGAFGDGGAIVTDNLEYGEKIRCLRNYGKEGRYENAEVGLNSRLDELQAGILRIKLSHINDINNERKRIAEFYLENINNRKIHLPEVYSEAEHAWQLFVLRTEYREQFSKYLEAMGIGYLYHYPIPPYLSKAYQYLRLKKGTLPITEMYADEVISIPMFNGLKTEEIEKVVDVINRF